MCAGELPLVSKVQPYLRGGILPMLLLSNIRNRYQPEGFKARWGAIRAALVRISEATQYIRVVAC